MRLDCLCTYTVKNLEFLDTPVYTHVHVHGDHARIQGYNDGTHYKCMTNYGFSHVAKLCMKCCSHMIFSSMDREFLNQENFC